MPTNSPTTKRDHAIHWAEWGFYIFPLEANTKLPLAGSNGHLEATTDPDLIRERWTDPLTGGALDYNIGLSPRDGKHLIIDLDVKDGREGISNYLALGGQLGGLVVRTPSGGVHVYCTGDDLRTGASKIAEGIDTRGADGYVVAPGSTIDGAPYAVERDGPLLPVPAFVAEKIGTRHERDVQRYQVRLNIESDQPQNVARAIEVATAFEPACSGRWHELGFKLGAELCRVGLSPEKLIEVAAEHWVPRGDGFKSYDQFCLDVTGGWSDAHQKGEHGAHSVNRQIAAFNGITIEPAPDDGTQPPCSAAVALLPAAEAPASPAGPAWVLRNPADIDDGSVPAREFLVPGWLSPGHVTMLYADGGIGKSLLALQLMTALATGRPWLGLEVPQCRTLGLFCEDSEDELARRQRDINRAMGLARSDLNDMRYISGLGEDNSLVRFDRDGRMVGTDAYVRLYAEACAFQPRLIVVDTAADVFDGNEVSRREVRSFIGTALGRLARDRKAAVLLCGQPSRDGLKTGRLDGGSTAWNNTVRARWTLARPEGTPGEVDEDERVLTSAKSNYGRTGSTLRMRWSRGAFMPVAPLTLEEERARLQHAENVFLTILNRAGVQQGQHFSPHRNAGNYAPKRFALRDDREGLLRSDFERAMDGLLNSGILTVESYGRPSRPLQRLAIARRHGSPSLSDGVTAPCWSPPEA